jgi:hypothetical protein
MSSECLTCLGLFHIIIKMREVFHFFVSTKDVVSMVSQKNQYCIAYGKVLHKLNILVRKGWMVFLFLQ